ncbi:MAG TPA: hypothetical protein VMZ28_24980 [Kofleriaceae bacterium]|nr:hypothetical protein [Kofleriaceae bacterium]
MRSVLRALRVFAALLPAACAPAWKRTPHDERFQHAITPPAHARPRRESLPGDWWDRGRSSTIVPLGRVISPAAWARNLGWRRAALDVNAWDEVPDSTWFENRIGRREMSPEEIERGPGSGTGPALGKLLIISGKLEGATPGLIIRDAAGVTWFVKFDKAQYREMATGAEVVAQRLMHAAGYLVPDMQIVDLQLSRLVLAPDAMRNDEYGSLVPLTRRDLAELLINLNPTPTGRIRALFSKQLEGDPIGPFGYRGVRIDDPNDRIPHERRRSLRGLWVFSAWLNNTDVRRQNTLDTFIAVGPRKDRGYVRHFLIDFGDSLGSAGERGKFIGEGYEGAVEWPAVIGRLFGVGLRYPYWVTVRRTREPAVGVFEAKIFDPARWEPRFPNPAFDEATPRDTYWAAAILAHFDRARVAAAVGAARYGRAEAGALVLDVLMKRRDKLLRHAFRRMAPLGDPDVRGWRVAMRDLEELAGLAGPSPVYRVEVRWNRTGAADVVLERGALQRPAIDLARAAARARALPGFGDDPFLTVSWTRPRGGRIGPAVELHLRVARDRVVPVGLERQVAQR